MNNETILTPAQVDSLLEGVLRVSGSSLSNYTTLMGVEQMRGAIRAIERAVLQSPEIQAMKDALRELISIVEIHSSVTKNNFAWAELDEAKSAIAAMKQK